MMAWRLLMLCATTLTGCAAFTPAAGVRMPAARSRVPAIRAAEEEKPQSLEAVTEKYGLEAGLFSAVKKGVSGGDEEEKKGSMAQAGDLLKKYGGAYLLTSTSLAIVSFSLCYFLIDNGVDVGALLGKVGIEVDSTSETVGTVGIAYAIHKAASPIRFPPTVALTPIVAKKVFGREEPADEAADEA
jgi:hypothetical protein